MNITSNLYNQNFTGLTSNLKRTILNRNEIENALKMYPEANGFVGSLPYDWISMISKEKRGEVTKEFQEGFSEIIDKLNTHLTTRKATKKLQQLLTNIGITTPNETIKLKYCGSGDFSTVYKLTVNKQNYALKIFNNDAIKVNNSFGNMLEQNNALYINAKKGTDWSKFYFGNLKDKYMLTDYISWSDKKPSKEIDLSKKGVEYIDYSIENYKNGVNIDYGGIECQPDFPMGDKIAIKTINKLKKLCTEYRLKEIEKIENDKKNLIEYKHKKIGVDYFIKNNQTVDTPPKNMGFFEEMFYYMRKYM